MKKIKTDKCISPNGECTYKKKNLKILYLILFFVFLSGACFFGYQIIGILKEDAESEASYEQIRENVFVTITSVPLDMDITDDAGSKETNSFLPKPAPSNKTGKEEIKVIDVKKLKSLYPDAIGWLSIEGTVIDYPLVYTDNNETYVNYTADGKKNKAGSIFLDCRNEGDLTDKNSIIYGHNMRNGSMFGSLKKYLESSYGEDHNKITLTTADGVKNYEIFSVYITKVGSESYTRKFDNESKYKAFVEQITSQSLYKLGKILSSEEPIITLSTCTDTDKNKRLVIHAKLITDKDSSVTSE